MHVVRLGLAALERRGLEAELVEHLPLQLHDPLGAADDVQEHDALVLELRVPVEDELERLDARGQLVEVLGRASRSPSNGCLIVTCGSRTVELACAPQRSYSSTATERMKLWTSSGTSAAMPSHTTAA